MRSVLRESGLAPGWSGKCFIIALRLIIVSDELLRRDHEGDLQIACQRDAPAERLDSIGRVGSAVGV